MREGENGPKNGPREKKGAPRDFDNEFKFREDLAAQGADVRKIQPFNNFWMRFLPASADIGAFRETWVDRLEQEHPDVFKRAADAIENARSRGESPQRDNAVNRALYDAYLKAREYVDDEWDLFS